MKTKCCSKCKIEKTIDKFTSRGLYKNGEIRYQGYCKECQNINSRRRYNSDPEKHKALVRTNKKKYRADTIRKLQDFLSCHPCVDCGITDIRTLEFDHVRGVKKNNVSSLLQSGNCWSTIKQEIDKCEVRCANCHNIRTHEHNKSWRTLPLT